MKSRIILFFIALTLSGQVFSQNAKQHFKAGEQFFENGMLDAAIEAFEKSMHLDPNDGRAYESLAKILIIKGDSLAAADNFRRAAALNYNPGTNYYLAAKIYIDFSKLDKAFESIDLGLASKTKQIDLLLLKTEVYFEQEDYSNAYQVSSEAIKAKDLALAYYYNGASAYKLGLIEIADKNLEKAIIRDKNLVVAYLTIAEMQIDQEKFDYAIDNCSMVLLLMDPESVRALELRSRAFHNLKESEYAIADITKAIGFSDNDYNLILYRAEVNLDYALYADAIQDYSIAIEINDSSINSYSSRAYAYEQIGEKKKALEDYLSLLVLLSNQPQKVEMKTFAENKIFELGKEEEKPELILLNPYINDKLEFSIEEGKTEVTIKGSIIDNSGLKEVKINNIEVPFLKEESNNYSFSYTLSTENLDFVSITVVDVYENLNSKSYPVTYIETQGPVVELISPIAGGADIIQLETDDNTLYIEGRVIDKSYITSIKIDEVNASFTPGDYNPKFTATIDVQNRKNITITATDAFGNESKKTYEFAKDGYLLSSNNPMGKTWVIIIENSNYNEFSNLSGPEQDVKLLSQALQRYQISKVLRKKNMTKHELERFFAIDLRDLILSNQVNSLLIWYAGHGQTVNDMGYWVPVDGRQGDEYSYYNINALKASLYSYQALTHILVVSDACHAGESFTIAMRGTNNSLASCDDVNVITRKSALVLTSSYEEVALDNSLFTKTFANALANNPADCIPVDAIAERLSIVMYKNSAQKPVFGRIAGLEDKNGTFFFVTK